MSLEHFLTLASNGRHDTASSGEKACQRIAKAILAMRDDLASIDFPLRVEACEILQQVAFSWAHEPVQQLLEVTRPLPVIPLEDRE